jgi:hypothetical protein
MVPIRFVVSLALGAGLLIACTPTPSPSPTPQASIAPSPSAPTSPQATPTPGPPSPSLATESATCVPFTGELPAGLEGDPCPSALAAVRAIIEPLGFPIARIYIEPGPFLCGNYLWPGIESPPECFGPIIIPGTMMRGWVAFHRTDKVAAVELRRDVPRRASPFVVPPWRATVVAFVVPPTGCVMP